jgi:hypothetical protein
MFPSCFHKCIVCHEHHTFIMTHCTSQFLWYRYVLINLIMYSWHLRPKFVFLSRHIFRGSNLYYIELFALNWHILLPCLFPLVHLHISYLSCAKAKTNIFPWVSCVLSLILKGKWSIRQKHRFHSTPSVLSILCRYSAISQNWYNLHSYSLVPLGEKVKRAHISLTKYPFLAIHAKVGESIIPKQKDPHHHQSQKVFKCFNLY